MFRPSPYIEERRSALSFSITRSLQAPFFKLLFLTVIALIPWQAFECCPFGNEFCLFSFLFFLEILTSVLLNIWVVVNDDGWSKTVPESSEAKTNDQSQVPVLTTVDLKWVQYKSHGVLATILFSGNASSFVGGYSKLACIGSLLVLVTDHPVFVLRLPYFKH